MEPYYEDIDNISDDDNYRKVLYTIPRGIQLVSMSLNPREEIGMEIHPYTTQLIFIIEGLAVVTIDDLNIAAGAGSIQVIPPGSNHNVINASNTNKLKLLSIYNPPEHHKRTVQRNK